MRRLLWPLGVLAATIALVTVAVPPLTIHPFRPQSTSGVAWAYGLKRAAPMATTSALAVVVACAALLWRGARRWSGRGLLVLLVAMTGLVTWFARQNHFEWMFNPLGAVEYASVTDARTFLVDAEIVMGIEVKGVALAYPIRQLAYHHVVNEVAGGTPLVVTY
jgi:hypothetical protein